VNPRQLLLRLQNGAIRNVAFNDFVSLVEGFGFRLSRSVGSHHIYTHPGIEELINLQRADGEAKPYQIRQFLRLVDRYNLRLKDPQ